MLKYSIVKENEVLRLVPPEPQFLGIPASWQGWKPALRIQREGKTCGQHCVAMISHLSLEVVFDQFGHRHATKESEIAVNMRWCGYGCNHWEEFKFGFMGLGIVDVRCKENGRRWWHVLVIYKGYCFDTNGCAWEATPENFKFRGYKPKKILEVFL